MSFLSEVFPQEPDDLSSRQLDRMSRVKSPDFRAWESELKGDILPESTNSHKHRKKIISALTSIAVVSASGTAIYVYRQPIVNKLVGWVDSIHNIDRQSPTLSGMEQPIGNYRPAERNPGPADISLSSDNYSSADPVSAQE